MGKGIGRDILRRWPGNPLLQLSDLNFPISDICNAGCVAFEEEMLLLVTVEAMRGQCSLYLAHSHDGHHFWMEQEPFMRPSEDLAYSRYECLSVRDARVTPLDDTYYIAYLAEGDAGFRIGLAKTDDFREVTRLGYITQPDTKNGCLFPRKIRGRYAMLERPSPGASIWLSTSEDREFWGESDVVITPRGGFWDSDRVGPAGPPIEIDEGWLVIYYGVKATSAGPLFRLGATILDRDFPSTVIARSNIPMLSPREKYERIGDVGNLVFSCGAQLREDGELRIYYGAADSCICLATAGIEEIAQACLRSGTDF